MAKLAISPCPNDTFIFHAWIKGLVGTPPDIFFADIQELNQLAFEKKFPLIKASFFTFAKLQEFYTLLHVGAALGDGMGPKIIAREPLTFSELQTKKVAIPGIDTTAHFLFDALGGQAREKRFCLYHEIKDLLMTGQVDCGVIIHESRFTFEKDGFFEVADLGKLWQERFHLPLPLGGIFALKEYENEIPHWTDLISQSLAYAKKNPEASLSFILEKSQEQDLAVVKQHIDLYVTKETEWLSSKGKEAVKLFVDLYETTRLCHA